ncbi:chromosome replication initiation inhibitor protein [Massilia sp. Root418]|jgi:LysR family transcriptional regulator (chromosome initiation inhibitor)|uniref:ArgP/LysG family DNA-binding transcriptional regulator n=1 Tax=Massilia sp. Root418 TaxID=1736532 RepID=UPI0006F26B70|nr:ArgP/LysG family DNA-binding transcriptional regulator [Massilia sp. Root418]KQW89844.1 chromosome replication initiation inhibitor protein [Massilia sp. Root418]
MANLDYKALAVLDAVASHGSFEKAAGALGISQSAVSQRIKALEDSSGRLLIVRGVPCVPTGLGQRLISHHRNVRLMEASLDIDLGNRVSMPEISIAVDAASLATWFPLALPPLLAPPRCQLDVQQAGREQALHMVQEGSVFGAVAARTEEGGAAPLNGPATTPLGTMRYLCVATPAFAGRWFGDGFSAEAVQLAPAVVSERAAMARFLAGALGEQGSFPHHTLPVSPAQYECIYGGLAYGLLPQLHVAGAIDSERLVDLAPGQVLDVALDWHAWNLDTPFTRALSEQIITSARRYLLQP